MQTSPGRAAISPVPFAEDERLSAGTRKFLTALNSGGGDPLETVGPEAARKVLENAQASVEVDVSGIDESTRTIQTDAGPIELNIVRPEGKTEKLPAFMFIHGGGWVLGDYPTHKRLVRDIVVESGYPAVFINYTRTPEAVYPTQVNQTYAATKWVAENGDEINIDGRRLAVVGNSVGGNMTAATTLMTIEKDGPELKASIMMWPVTDADFGRDSWNDFSQDRFLTSSLMKWMWDLYAPVEKRGEPLASPVKADLETLGKFPPTLVQVAENDILRDEGEAFGRRLDEAGATATTVRYDGMIHDFGLLNALAGESGTRSMIRHAAAELKKRLG
jgi:acetyl esterase